MRQSGFAISKLFRSLATACAVASGLLLASWASPLQARSGSPRVQKHESRHEIDQLEVQWRDAVLKGDTALMSSLLADDYMAITPVGTLQNKDEALASIRNGRLHFTSLNLSDRKVRFYGSTALVTSIAEVEGTGPQGDISGSYRYTHVYARTPQGDWKIVNFEANRVRNDRDHR